MKRYVIIVAGGKGLRMGADLPKQFIPIEGKPVLMHTLEAFNNWDDSAEIVLVLPEDHQSYWQMLCGEIGCGIQHHVVNGGETRFDSVRNGLEFLSEEFGISLERKEKSLIAVHDGVRPFITPDVIENCFENAEREKTAIPVVPMVESIREITEEGTCPVDRNRFFAVQTPQVFHSEILLEAYQQTYSPGFTDDASVVEAMGQAVHIVPGNRKNMKITTPFDLLIAKALFSYRQ